MDWSIKKNRSYLLLLVVFCGLIPHGMLALLQIASGSGNWSPSEIETYSKFFVCEWTPLCAAIIAYLRLQKRDNFSLLPAITFGLIVPTLLPRFRQISEVFVVSGYHDGNNAIAIAFAIPVMLLMECSGLLGKLESSENRILSAIAADRGLLRAFLFWSVGILCLAFISCEACAYYSRVISPLSLIPIPGVLLFEAFRHQKQRPPTVWSAIGMLLMAPGSLLLTAIGPMKQFQGFHVTILLSGYAVFFLMLTFCNMDHWRKPKAANGNSR